MAMADKARLVRALAAIVGPRAVISEGDELLVYECDGLTCYKAVPEVVVLPETTAQVAAVVRLCHAEGVPFVPRGAGTGLSGGALPVEGGVMIGLSRMNGILDIDLENGRAVVEPGVINLWVTQRVAPHGLYYAPDPSSQQACSIGGNVAENSGGPHCLKYGVTANHVLGLELVRTDGSVATLGGMTVDPPGYDLTGVFVGSEGTFGIVTKVMVRLLPKPEAVKTLLGVYEAIDDASATVSGIIGRGIIAAALEIMDQLSIQAVEAAVQAGYPTDAGAVLLVELDGPRAEVEALTPRIVEVMRENRVREVRIAKDDAERALLWKGRKTAFGAMGRISPDYYVQDAVIPRTRLPQILGEIAALSARHGLRVANVFHAGDGNLHPLILYDGRHPDELKTAEAIGAEIMKACVAVGGSITGEHGVGCEKQDFMPWLYSPADLAAMRKVRDAFNPRNLCNPNKILPTNRSCVEVGRAWMRYTPHRLEREGIAQRF